MNEFVVIGDASLDVVVSPSEPPRQGSDVPAAIRIGPGGQGANVAVRLARQGISARLVSSLADDAAGRLLREILKAEGVTVAAVPARRSTVVLALLDPTGERTMLSDRQTLDPAGLTKLGDAIHGAAWLHCSGYALLDDRTGDGLAEVIGARSGSIRCSVAGGSFPPDPARISRLRPRLVTARPDLVVLSAGEATTLLGRASSATAAAGALRDVAAVAVVTDGPRGSAAAAGDLLIEQPADDLPSPVLDTTGSGDAYVAALLVQLAATEAWPPAEGDLQRAMAAGSRLGAFVARVVGAQTRVDGERPAE